MNDDTNLYNFPIGNVYDDLRICWGNTRLPSISSVVQLSGIPNIFYSAPFNGDLMGNNSFRGYGHNGMHIVQFLDMLTEHTYFPMDRLIQWGTLRNFKQRLIDYAN
ncbi:hypothetical protein D3C80_1560790 [compost metagenome]